MKAASSGLQRSAALLDLAAVVASCSIAMFAAGCGPVNLGPPASVTTLLGGQIRMTWAGAEYEGFGAYSKAPDPADPLALVIPPDALTPIGRASDFNAAVFPDGVVYAIRNVIPNDALAMFDRSGPEAELVVFTRGGTSPTQIRGLCVFYLDPTLRLCGGQPTQTSFESAAPNS
jgi:hypothetical protein